MYWVISLFGVLTLFIYFFLLQFWIIPFILSVVDGMTNLIVLAAEMLAAFFKINCLSCEMSLILLVDDPHFTKYSKEYKRDAKYLNLHNFAVK